MPLRLTLCLVTALSWGLSANAQEALGAEAFEQEVLGKTYVFASNGSPYGMERYDTDRRVVWKWLETGECIPGTWYEVKTGKGPAICFDYEDQIGTQCWWYTLRPDGSIDADFVKGSGVNYEAVAVTDELICPDVFLGS